MVKAKITPFECCYVSRLTRHNNTITFRRTQVILSAMAVLHIRKMCRNYLVSVGCGRFVVYKYQLSVLACLNNYLCASGCTCVYLLVRVPHCLLSWKNRGIPTFLAHQYVHGYLVQYTLLQSSLKAKYLNFLIEMNSYDIVLMIC